MFRSWRHDVMAGTRSWKAGGPELERERCVSGNHCSGPPPAHDMTLCQHVTSRRAESAPVQVQGRKAESWPPQEKSSLKLRIWHGPRASRLAHSIPGHAPCLRSLRLISTTGITVFLICGKSGPQIHAEQRRSSPIHGHANKTHFYS